MLGNRARDASHSLEVAGSNAARRDDHDLARRCVAGDADAERALFEAHRHMVHVILFRLLGGNREIEDALQDVFFAVFRSLPSYRAEATLATWISRIAVRVGARAAERRRDLPSARLELVVEDHRSSPAAIVEAREAARRLYRVLDDVEPRHRAAFLLHVVDGRSLPEVAALTDATVIATKLRVWRTRKRVERAAREDAVLASFLSEPAEAVEGS
jgi:RNA polymerase sigma-70 factor (ECF subfamily)